MKILLIGGSKSGKSMLAQRLTASLAEKDGSLPVYWATMEPTDGEDRERIKKHIMDRAGWGFETIECARNIEPRLPEIGDSAAVLFDSITALTANELFGTAKSGYLSEPDGGAEKRIIGELKALTSASKHTVMVCDDIFRDGKTYDPATELFRRTLANVCRALAASCDAVCEIVCSRAVPYKGELPEIQQIVLHKSL